MYAVIRTGGKQYRVAEGDTLQVELVGDPDTEVSFDPVLVVNDGSVKATPADLAGATVSAKVLDTVKGPKIDGFTYKSKTNQRRRWGHRQKYSLIEITKISA